MINEEICELRDKLNKSIENPYSNYNTVNSSHSIMTVEHYIDELQTVIDYFGFDKFILYGHSWGTMLSVEYALAKILSFFLTIYFK